MRVLEKHAQCISRSVKLAHHRREVFSARDGQEIIDSVGVALTRRCVTSAR